MITDGGSLNGVIILGSSTKPVPPAPPPLLIRNLYLPQQQDTPMFLGVISHQRSFIAARILCTAILLFWMQATTTFAATPSLDEDDAYLNTVSPIVSDPLESWNRAMHGFNDAMLENVARPVYKGYAFITPQIMRTGFKNAFHNLLFPVRFVSNVLQGKGRAAGVEMSRFILNSTAGLGGFIDVAKSHKPIVPVDEEDMGQTFGVWGIGEGFYIVWPFLGPSTLRDSTGKLVDYFLDPVTYISPTVAPTGLSIGIAAVRTFNSLDDILDQYDALKGTAVEPYSSFRDAYIQHRRAKIAK